MRWFLGIVYLIILLLAVACIKNLLKGAIKTSDDVHDDELDAD